LHEPPDSAQVNIFVSVSEIKYAVHTGVCSCGAIVFSVKTLSQSFFPEVVEDCHSFENLIFFFRHIFA